MNTRTVVIIVPYVLPQARKMLAWGENSRCFTCSCQYVKDREKVKMPSLNFWIARDSWKKKYFETKKATAPLEEKLKNLRQELETFYNKLLHQLQARDNRGKPRRQGRSSIKVNLIYLYLTCVHLCRLLLRYVKI